MKRNPPQRAAFRSSDAARSRWTRLAHDDATGVDGDIEALLDRVQRAQGGSRAMANAELLRRLAFAS